MLKKLSTRKNVSNVLDIIFYFSKNKMRKIKIIYLQCQYRCRSVDARISKWPLSSSHWRHSVAFIVDFEQILRLGLMFFFCQFWTDNQRGVYFHYMELQCMFYNPGNYIAISNYNISVLTMKVILLFNYFFLQNTTNQTTNKIEFLQCSHSFYPAIFQAKLSHPRKTTIFGRVDPPL